MLRLAVTFVLLCLLLVCWPSAHASVDAKVFLDPRALALVHKFEATWGKTHTARYRIVKTERLRSGKTLSEDLNVKLDKGRRVYMRMNAPIAGREMIYDRTKDRHKLVVHPGHFPDLTLHLPVRGMLATHNQHHTIDNVGFEQALHVLRLAMKTSLASPQGERLEYWGEATFDGRAVAKIAMLSGSRKARSERGKNDESLFAFAERVGSDPYVILAANPKIRSLTSELDDEDYVVPPYYAHKCESWHDLETGMPLNQMMYDESGRLYEQYQHFDLELDPALSNADFDPDNPDYGF